MSGHVPVTDPAWRSGVDADLAPTYAERERLALAGSGIDPDADQP